MRLYHFCPDFMLDSILREGLTRGQIAWIENRTARFVKDMQWLTSNGDPNQQEWCNPEYANLPYDRAANRVSVNIPEAREWALSKWLSLGPLVVPAVQFANLNAWGDPENYWIFRGVIPPDWLSDVERYGDRIVARRKSA